jgi:hypothetical protein
VESRSERCGVAEPTIVNVVEGRREQAMKKALTITLVAAIALFAGSAAYANYCARDVVPASTILVPYAVNAMSGLYTADFDGQTTILTITNVSMDATIIHITVWNAESEACLDFNEVLTGYDVWQINFRDMLNGDFAFFDTSQSSTASPNTGNRVPFEWGPDGRSAYQGGVSFLPTPQTTVPPNLPSTLCYMPYGTAGKLNVNSNIDCLRGPIFSRTHNGCGNLNIRADYLDDWLKNITANWGNNLWYYVTVDVVKFCNLAFPSTPNYFTEFYLNENVLIGDIVYLNKTANYSEAINAVHLESDIDSNIIGPTNFYEEIDNPDGTSFIEPLATAFAFHYYNIDALSIKTDVILWKNFADFLGTSPYKVDDCGYYVYYTWDMDEHTISRAGSCRVSPCNPNDIDPNEFPFESQRVPVTKKNFDIVGTTGNESGWMLILFPPTYINTPAWVDPTPTDLTHGPADQNIWMGWVGVRYTYGTYSAGLEAATMANTHCFADQQLPQIGVGYTRYVGE